MTELHTQFLKMQLDQLEHDKQYHSDIYNLSKTDKLKHYTLHLSKYVGRYIDASMYNNITVVISNSWMINMSLANLFNLDIYSGFNREFDLHTVQDTKDLTLFMSELYVNKEDDFIRTFAYNIADLAKCCESTDHLEYFPYSSRILTLTVNIAKVLLAECEFRNINLISEVSIRRAAVRNNNIFTQLNHV